MPDQHQQRIMNSLFSHSKDVLHLFWENISQQKKGMLNNGKLEVTKNTSSFSTELRTSEQKGKEYTAFSLI